MSGFGEQIIFENPVQLVLGTGLGTSKSTKVMQIPSEATPDKRDIVFDFISHNPKVVGSNPTIATNSQGLVGVILLALPLCGRVLGKKTLFFDQSQAI